ncbi:MAG: acyltransferase [Lachnospiraceae bacterium]|nr:acyltransferase [Lachnospiraceae bacterium]
MQKGGIIMDSSNNTRKHYLDNIRWITVVLVVIYHVLYMFNGEGMPGTVGKITDLEVQYYDVYQYIVYPWFMLVLFIISGISSKLYLDKHTDREFIKSRTAKLLVPSTIGLAVFQFIQGYFNMSLAGAFEQMEGVPKFVIFIIMMASGIGVLWYIQLLWVFCIVLIPIRKIEKNRLWNLAAKTNIIALILAAVLIHLAAQVLNTPVICVYRFGFYLTGFLLGYFVFSHDEVINVLKKWLPLTAVMAAVLGTAFCMVNFGGQYADAPANRTPLFTTYAWFMSLAILGAGTKYLDFQNAFTSWMSRHSWGLYIFHYLGISVVGFCIGKPGLLPPVLTYILALIAGFAAGYLLYGIISRIPFFRWAVLGIKKEKRI